MINPGKSAGFRNFLSRFSLYPAKSTLEKKWAREFKRVDRLLAAKNLRALDPAMETLTEWLFVEFSRSEIRPEWYNQCGLICQAYTGDFSRAEKCFRLAREASERLGDQHQNALSMTNLGALFLDQNRSREAVEIFNQLKPVIEQHYGKESRETAVACQNLAAALRLEGKEEDAKAERIRATRILRNLA